MKILHTSDWHLGKKLYKKERWPEQQLFLTWLLETIAKEEVEVLIIAGDIFDTPMPPNTALKGLFEFYRSLEELTKTHSLKKVVVIGGNHDSGRLIETPGPLLDENIFHLLGRPIPSSPQENQGENESDWITKHRVDIDDISISMLPFFRGPDLVNFHLKASEEISAENLLLDALDSWQKKIRNPKAKTNILVGHHLYGSFMESGSEQGVSLSGLASIPLSLWKDWDLLCLGHIHKPQLLKKEEPLAIYSGSPIAMRFSETEKKKVFLYETDKTGPLAYDEILIPAFRPLIKIESTPEEWEEKLESFATEVSQAKLPAFLELTLNFPSPEPQYIDVVREKLKDQNIELLNYYQIVQSHKTEKEETIGIEKIQNAHINDLFSLFLDEVGSDQDEKRLILETFEELLEELNHKSSDEQNDDQNMENPL